MPRNTIPDKDWKSLQDRARGQEKDFLGKEATDRRKKSNDNFKN